MHDWAIGPGGKPRMDMGWTWESILDERRQRRIVDTALSRLHLAAKELGAHGVIGVTLTIRPIRSGACSFFELCLAGTAVVATGAPPPVEPFTTGLDAADVCKLAGRGFAPAHFAIGIGSVRGQLGRTSRRHLRSRTNTEVEQYTEVTQQALTIARRDLERHRSEPGALVLGADAQIHAGRPALEAVHEVLVRMPGSIVRPRHATTMAKLEMVPAVHASGDRR